MIVQLHVIAWYTAAFTLLANAVLFWLQIHTYRRVGHRSLVFLLVGSGLGLLACGFLLVPLIYAASLEIRLLIYFVVAIVMTAQGAFGIYGTAALLKAFETALEYYSAGKTPR